MAEPGHAWRRLLRRQSPYACVVAGAAEQVAISVAATAIAGAGAALSKPGRRAVSRAWTWLRTTQGARPDHLSIEAGWYAMPSAIGAGPSFRVMTACAPATRRISPRPLDADRVEAFVSAAFPEAFDPTPDHRNVNEVVRYRRPWLPAFNGEAVVCVYPSGLVEATLTVPYQPVGAGCCVALADLVGVVKRLAVAVHAGRYRELYESRTGEVLDWRIGFTDGVTPSTNHLPLIAFSFDGPVPRSGPAVTRIACPQPGLASAELRSSPQSTAPSKIVAATAQAALVCAGYAGFDATLASL